MSANLLGRSFYGIGLSVWVVFSLVLGQSLAALALAYAPIALNSAVKMTILSALGYGLALTIALALPVLAFRKRISLESLGLSRLPTWADIGLGALSLLPYYLISGVLIALGTQLFRVINPDVGQQIGFENLHLRIEYFVAFITLVVLAPIAEELLFRGYFLGKLRLKFSKWIALVVSALVFGMLHLPGFTDTGVVWQWSAAVDTFAMGLTAGSLRLISGSIWAGVLLHAIKNAIAFYFLFISPLSAGGM